MLDASQENSLADLQQQLSSLVEKCYKVATEVNLAGKQLLAELAVEKDRNVWCNILFLEHLIAVQVFVLH